MPFSLHLYSRIFSVEQTHECTWMNERMDQSINQSAKKIPQEIKRAEQNRKSTVCKVLRFQFYIKRTLKKVKQELPSQ